MKVILVTHTFLPHSVGGREKHVFDIGKVLSRRGHKVEIFTCSDSLFKYKEKRENKNLIIRYFSTIHIPMVLGYYRIPLTMLYNLLRTNADIIHTHEYFHFTTFISSVAAAIKKIPLVLTEHGCPEQIGALAFFLELYHKICLPQIISSSKKVIAVSKFMKAEVMSKFNLPSEKVSVVYNGIRLSGYAKKSNVFRKKYGLRDEKIILGIGRLIKEKGFQYLIKALPTILKKIPNVKVVIIGPDHYFKKSLVKYSEYLGVKDKVIFTGNVSEHMLKSAIYCSDVVVIPSFYEPFGIVALEAMAYGKPIVASKVGGLKEFLTNNKTCLFFRPKDSKSLAGCVLKVLSNKSLSQRLGKNAREDVKNFDWNKIINKLINVYEEVYEKN